MVLDHPLIAERYFFPRPGSLEQPRVIDCGDADLACYHEVIDAAAPTLVHFHGNGEIVPDYVPDISDGMRALGVNLFFAEYRGYGDSSGRPLIGAMLDDVERIFEALGLPEEQLIVFGRSVGSLFAIELASRHPAIRGLILESGIADLLERLLLRVRPEELGVTRSELESAVAARLDHQKKLGAFPGALLVMHAEHDQLIDVSHARRNYAWAAGSTKAITIFPDGDHNSIMVLNWQEYWSRIKTFLAAIG